MAFLGNDFIVSSTIFIVVIFLLLYVYRQKIFKVYYKKTPFDLFIQNIKRYLKENHSKIKFNYSIIDKSSTELNPTTRQYLICDNLIEQFITIELKNIPIPNPIQQNQLWDSYTFNSRPNGLKLPEDWTKRKLIVLKRDHNICQRCGVFTKIENAHLILIKSIKEGGQFYLENLVIICKDCHKITTKKDLKYLDIQDKLNSFIQLQ